LSKLLPNDCEGGLSPLVMRNVVAIDGPAGAGKSTVAKLLAHRLGFLYIDTGAMYRALTLKVLREGIRSTDDEAVGSLAGKVKIDLVPSENGLRVFLDGEDVTDEIRSPEVSRHVSYVARIYAVRERMTALQREMARNGKVVMEGRDIGTCVLPEADHKFFVTASVRERARRRQGDLRLQGHDIDLETLVQEIEKRDYIDSTREVAPLKPALDAKVIDTTGKTVEEVVGLLAAEVLNRQ